MFGFFILIVTGLILFLFFIVLFLLPFTFTFYSLITIFSVPAQLIKLAKNPFIRKNHAIEHATINVLEEMYGIKRLAGFSEEDGYFLFGSSDMEKVENASREGLQRLKEGEKKLAIHKECGTSAGVANFIMALAFIVLLVTTGAFSVLFFFFALLIVLIIGPVLGELAQEFLTTSSKVESIDIDHIEMRVFNPFNTSKPMESQIFVVTKVNV